jgi:hypothetical protein
MKMLFCALSLAAAATMAVVAQGPPTVEQDKAAVRQAAYDYAEGYYEGAADRVERAVDSTLVKRGLLSRPGPRLFLAPMNAETLVEATRSGGGKSTPADKRGLSFALLDLRENVASAKIFTATFNDYLHLVKRDDRWRLVNVLWQPPSPNGVANGDADKAAVAQVFKDFFDAVPAGDAARVDRLVHPEAAMRAFGPTQAGRFVLREGNRESIVEMVRAKAVPPPQAPVVTVLDVYDNIASAMVTTPTSVSYWHLAKQDGQWRLVNRLSR